MLAEKDSRYMDLKEFRNNGFLLEANRQFFHPLGLALTVYYDDNDPLNTGGADTEAEPVGLFLQDYRDDPEGFGFAEFTEEDKEKAAKVEKLKQSKEEARIKLFGAVIQPIE